ncbi:TetR/AcrR family transcriptional regulator C-terminal domain-containing protein [Pararhizobium sp. IMCC21322]|uniref:TetR/AcrR family transcriptional regulator C-terminal domain-containing protein n=1 Tax=Pararhizobium sp. IMCC21322 TaxID=3067903 RepID=UPI0027418CE1|nr:TetR/AcrR family transcriptional regulator C-terminal domain-containing protein [Pararhizobium sp. IMCC21322]
MATILQKHIDAGELAIGDVPLAARQFQELITADLFHVAAFGICIGFTRADIG